MREIGILGGTFDPIHNGHIELARQAYKQFYLDEVWILPSPNPPHKTGKKITDFKLRFDMAAIAAKKSEFIKVSDFELHLGYPSYTYLTLEKLKEKYQQDNFSFIMGADSLYEFEKWKNPDVILKYARLLVAGRKYADQSVNPVSHREYLKAKYLYADIEILNYEEMDISSSQIREMISLGKDVGSYIDKEVYEMILNLGLY